MGSMGVPFEITEGLDRRSGATSGTIEDMRKVLDYFAYSRELVNEELAQVRYEAQHRTRLPGGVLVDVPGAAAALGGRDGHAGRGDPQACRTAR